MNAPAATTCQPARADHVAHCPCAGCAAPFHGSPQSLASQAALHPGWVREAVQNRASHGSVALLSLGQPQWHGLVHRPASRLPWPSHRHGHGLFLCLAPGLTLALTCAAVKAARYPRGSPWLSLMADPHCAYCRPHWRGCDHAALAAAAVTRGHHHWQPWRHQCRPLSAAQQRKAPGLLASQPFADPSPAARSE